MERFSDSRHKRSGGIVEFKGERIFDTGELLGQLHKKSGLTRAAWFERASQLSIPSLGTETILSDLKANRRKMPFNHIRPLIEALGLKKAESNYYIAELTKSYLPEKLRHLIKVSGGENQVDVLKNKNKALENKIFRLEQECMYQRYGGNEKTLEYLMSKSYIDSSTCLPLHTMPASSEDNLDLYGEFKTDSYERLSQHKNKWFEIIKLLYNAEPGSDVIEMTKLCLSFSAPEKLGDTFDDGNMQALNQVTSSPSDLWSWCGSFPRPRDSILVHAEILRQYQQMYPANTKILLDYYMAKEKADYENSKKRSGWDYKFVDRPNLQEGESFHHFLLSKYQSLFTASSSLYELVSPLGNVISENFEYLESAVFSYYISFVRDMIGNVKRVEANLKTLSDWNEEHFQSCKSVENLGKTLICEVYSNITIGYLDGGRICLGEAVHRFGSIQEKNIGAFGILQKRISVHHSFEDIRDVTFDLYHDLYTKGHAQSQT